MTSLQKKLNKLVKDGYVRVQRHPQLPLSIYTYTQKTEVERNWIPETLMARGLPRNKKELIPSSRYDKKYD